MYILYTIKVIRGLLLSNVRCSKLPFFSDTTVQAFSEVRNGATSCLPKRGEGARHLNMLWGEHIKSNKKFCRHCSSFWQNSEQLKCICVCERDVWLEAFGIFETETVREQKFTRDKQFWCNSVGHKKTKDSTVTARSWEDFPKQNHLSVSLCLSERADESGYYCNTRHWKRRLFN